MTEQDAAETGDAPDADSGTDDPTAEEDLDDTLADVIALVDEILDIEESTREPPTPRLADVDVETELIEGVRDTSDEETARVVALLRRRVEDLEAELHSREEELADLESRLRRKQADFQNYKKRQKERMESEKRRATEDLVGRLLDVRDSLARALEQDADADIRGGVETTLTQFDEQLKRENVDRIEPDPGDEVDPQRHETLATIASDQPADTIARVHRPGYEMADKVIRPAQVAVSDGADEE
jgi:molecular chaperone GrpE